MAPKRGAARKPNVAAMRSRLDDEFADLMAKERVQEADRDIIWFMNNLAENPSKLKGCLAALQSDMFDEKPLDDNFDKNINNIGKVPKKVFKDIIIHWFPNLAEQLTEMETADRQIIPKLIWYMSGTDFKDPIPCKSKQEFARVLSARKAYFQRSLDGLVEGHRVDWPVRGWYSLVPGQSDGDADARPVDYVAVKFHLLASAKPLPDYLKVTSNWSLEQNYSITNATLQSPAGVKPPWKISLANFFSDDADFITLWNRLKACSDDVEDTGLASGAAAASSAAASGNHSASVADSSHYQVSGSLKSKIRKLQAEMGPSSSSASERVQHDVNA
jgi:hypothetical protein